MLAQEFEGLRDVIILQHTPVVVRQGKLVLHVDVEQVVLAVVAHVVNEGAEHQRHHRKRLKELGKAKTAKQDMHSLCNISGMPAVVIRHDLRARIRALHPLQETPRLARKYAKLRQEVTLSERLPTDKLQFSALCQSGDLEDVDSPTLELRPEEALQALRSAGFGQGAGPAGPHICILGPGPWLRGQPVRRPRRRAGDCRLRRMRAVAGGASPQQPGLHVVLLQVVGQSPFLQRGAPDEATRQRSAAGPGFEALPQEEHLPGVVVWVFQQPPHDGQSDVADSRARSSVTKLPLHLCAARDADVPAAPRRPVKLKRLLKQRRRCGGAPSGAPCTFRQRHLVLRASARLSLPERPWAVSLGRQVGAD
mmetsp:Transcript_102465/g.260210  ORF Transcript_102465/g.260210 Transcript_102465/m.260210 type:complete len:365 (+) Transcript_102465:791-1885(+)